MKQRQWQKVFSIVRNYQKNLHGTIHYQSEYAKISEILNELEPYAYGEPDD
jgi:hypothetical protein